MTLLELVKTFCERQTLIPPAFVIGSQDTQVLQIKSLLDEVCEDLVTRWDWSALTLEATFETNGDENQGTMSAIAPHGFLRIINETIFNRTLRLPIYGPMTPQKWQSLKALPTTGPFYKYRIVGGRLLLNPKPAVGHLCAFEYASSNIVLDNNTNQTKAYCTRDDDTFNLPDILLLAGLRAKWREAKGLPYAEQFQRYEIMANDMKAREGSKPVVDMGGTGNTAFPGIFISPGNWMQP